MKPKQQKVYKYVIYLIAGFTFFGLILDTIGNSISLISMNVSIYGSLFILIFWLGIEIYFIKKGIIWILPGNKKIKVIRLKSRVRLFIIGVLIVFWIPTFFTETNDKINGDKDIPLSSLDESLEDTVPKKKNIINSPISNSYVQKKSIEFSHFGINSKDSDFYENYFLEQIDGFTCRSHKSMKNIFPNAKITESWLIGYHILDQKIEIPTYVKSGGYFYVDKNLKLIDLKDLKQLSPVFDCTFLNKGDTPTILTSITVNILMIGFKFGDGDSTRPPNIIDVSNRYQIALYDPCYGVDSLTYSTYSKYIVNNDTSVYNKSLYPPLYIGPNEPLRLQVELLNIYSEEISFTLDLEFNFSNGDTLSTGIFKVQYWDDKS